MTSSQSWAWPLAQWDNREIVPGRVHLPPADLDPASGRAQLSYRQAQGLFRAVAGGATLHQLRHSALTHAAEEGASTSTLLAYSGHTSVASLARYARVSPEALAHWQAQRDPAGRRVRPGQLPGSERAGGRGPSPAADTSPEPEHGAPRPQTSGHDPGAWLRQLAELRDAGLLAVGECVTVSPSRC